MAEDACAFSIPSDERLAQMKKECVSRWMSRMGDSRSCTSYFAGVASGACSSADLRAACAETSARFTVRDAESLCENLQQAHREFWPSFWSR